MLKRIICTAIAFIILCPGVYAIETSAESSILINAKTRQILYADDAKTRRGMASTTKIMTAVVALENKNTTDIITVSENAQNQEGSSIYLRKGEEVSLSDLLYGLMLNSGNDAAVAIAEGVGGSTENFVDMMNEKANDLGLSDTKFKNPSGLPDEEHYSTAYDMAMLMAYAMENPEFRKIIATKEHQIETATGITYLRNHNKLLWQNEMFIGGKTGYTKKHGRCFVSCSKKDDIELVAVTLDDRDDWRDHTNLHEYGFKTLEEVKITEKNEILCTRRIRGTRVNILADDNFSLALLRGRKKNITCKIHLEESVNKQINFGTPIGFGEIFVDDFFVGRVGLISGSSVNEPLKNVFYETFKYVIDMTLLK